MVHAALPFALKLLARRDRARLAELRPPSVPTQYRRTESDEPRLADEIIAQVRKTVSQ
jgi:hypothetical protein